MILKIKKYMVSIQKDKITVSSKWPHGSYKMSFPIQRLNPLTYLKPIFMIAARKLAPKWYFKNYPDPTWHICSICGEYVGNKQIEGIEVCAQCKTIYD